MNIAVASCVASSRAMMSARCFWGGLPSIGPNPSTGRHGPERLFSFPMSFVCPAGLRGRSEPRRNPMTKVLAGITTSVDGYVAGPDDRAGQGLGVGGERLHYWVFGGPWTYDHEPEGGAKGEDAAWLEEAMSTLGAVVSGRWTYEAADHWGGENPWDMPLF